MATLTAIARTTVGPAPRHKRRIPSSLTIRCSAWIEFLPDDKWFWETLNTTCYVCTTQSFSTLADREVSQIENQQKLRVIFYDSFHNFPGCSLYPATYKSRFLFPQFSMLISKKFNTACYVPLRAFKLFKKVSHVTWMFFISCYLHVKISISSNLYIDLKQPCFQDPLKNNYLSVCAYL